MQKYIKNDLSEIRYFEDDVTIGDWIDLKEYRLMTDEEIHKHENPYYYLTEIQKRDLYLKSLKPLTRYQFKRCLLENGFKLSEIEDKINTIEDEKVRELTLLGFNESDRFVRTDPSVLVMQDILGLSPEKIDELWEFGLTL